MCNFVEKFELLLVYIPLRNLLLEKYAKCDAKFDPASCGPEFAFLKGFWLYFILHNGSTPDYFPLLCFHIYNLFEETFGDVSI